MEHNTPEEWPGRRELWAAASRTTDAAVHCTPFTLPSSGVIVIHSSSTITLSGDAVFHPQCTAAAGDASVSTVVNVQDPFYASTSPQIYAIATATVISYMLVIMLLITPRTFFIGGSGGNGLSGMIGGASGSSSVVGVGGRPWLQKVAALLVSIALTIATVNTFKVAEAQYEAGFQDAAVLTEDVVGSVEIRVIRVISAAFLWLAQAQTLIRLFPRHREKVIIKWTGFALILLETIFNTLNHFANSDSTPRPRSYTDAIPALDYLFELSLSLLYAAWIIYYSIEKRRFAFFHSKMRNIFLVAVLSLVAVLIPVVFFVLDIAQPNLAAWGDYMRWVGQAAASVVVWEWVERIEALEREDRKDGILGREIFDGDEMLDVTPSTEARWPGSGSGGPRDGDASATTTGRTITNQPGYRTSNSRLSLPRSATIRESSGAIQAPLGRRAPGPVPEGPPPPSSQPSLPPTTSTPVSRTDTMSATSTDYAIHYHPISTSASPSGQDSLQPIRLEHQLETVRNTSIPQVSDESTGKDSVVLAASHVNQSSNSDVQAGLATVSRWRNIAQTIKRNQNLPPAQASQATVGDPLTSHVAHSPARINPLDRLRMRRNSRHPDTPLPLVVIPAQPRGTVWSPPPVPDKSDPGNLIHMHSSGQNSQANGSGARGENFQLRNFSALDHLSLASPSLEISGSIDVQPR